MSPKECLAVLLAMLLVVGGVSVFRRRELGGCGKEETLPLRGVLALLVMFGHIDKTFSSHFPVLHDMRWMTAAVAGFFLLSGYGLFKSYASARLKNCEGEYLSKFPLRSVIRLYVPYLFFFGLWCFVSSIMETSWVAPAPKTYVYGFLPMPAGWYVKALTLLYGVYWASFCLIRNRLAILGVVLGVFGYWFYYGNVPGVPKNAFVTVFLFPIGMTIAAYEQNIRAFILRHPLGVYGVTAVAVVATVFSRRAHVQLLALEPFYLMAGIAFWLCACSLRGLLKCRFLSWTGGLSYEIYLVHSILIQIVTGFGCDKWLGLALVVAVSYAVAFLMRPVFATASRRLLTMTRHGL